jgi:hypothetical protein
MEDKLYDLKIGESYLVDNTQSWLRVPGGWVYTNPTGCCFIPYIAKTSTCI